MHACSIHVHTCTGFVLNGAACIQGYNSLSPLPFEFELPLYNYSLIQIELLSFSSFLGQLIDGPQNGAAPGPWDIAAQPNQLFQDHEKHFEVPHTASVKMCHNCVGAGMTQCWRCRGRGRVRPLTLYCMVLLRILSK